MKTKVPTQIIGTASRFNLYTCQPDTRLGAAAETMVTADVSCLVVVDSDGYLVGVISRTDFLPLAFSTCAWRDEPVGRWMSRYVVTISQDATLADAVTCLLAHRIHRVVVLDSSQGPPRPVAVVADSDLLGHMLREIV